MNAKIFITGVSSGIGHALAEAFLQRGETVYGMSRRRPRDLEEYPNFLFHDADLADGESIASAANNLIAAGTCLELVVLNAGVPGKIADCGELTVDDFQDVMQINVWSNKVLLDALFARGCEVRQVTAISSHAANHALRGSGPYCLSKAALNMLIALYATEKTATHFSTVAPPLVNTAIQDYLTGQPADPRFSSLELLRYMKSAGRMMTPAQAANVLIRAFEEARRKPSGAFIDASQTAPSGVLHRVSTSIQNRLQEMGALARATTVSAGAASTVIG